MTGELALGQTKFMGVCRCSLSLKHLLSSFKPGWAVLYTDGWTSAACRMTSITSAPRLLSLPSAVPKLTRGLGA